jgi:hypothetical protein
MCDEEQGDTTCEVSRDSNRRRRGMYVEIEKSDEAVCFNVYFTMSLRYTMAIDLSVALVYEFFPIMAFYFECLDSDTLSPTH